jgi:hypothetical protein
LPASYSSSSSSHFVGPVVVGLVVLVAAAVGPVVGPKPELAVEPTTVPVVGLTTELVVVQEVVAA